MQVLLKKEDIKGLKAFALTMAWVFPAIFMGLLPWLFEQSIHWWPLLISASMLSLYAIYPKGIYYPYRGWMWIAGILGWINTHIIMALAFYVLILPIGLIMRALGKLQYKNKIKGQSNYIQRSEKPNKQQLENPF